jgi:hypothetical protein
VITLPPFDPGADQASVTWALPGVAVFRVGASGTDRGVVDTEFDGPLEPAAFVAVTVNE